MSNSILITGGAGFIGSHLAENLLQQGYKITVIDNFITGNKQNIQHLIGNPDFQLIEADISNFKTIQNLTNEYDYIFHLASPASPKGYFNNPELTYKANAWGTHYLVEYARNINAKMLYTSTSEAYGDPLVHPQTEDYWGNVNPIGVRACYDVAKRFGEMVCFNAVRNYNQDVKVVRIFNTFGPRNDPVDGRVIPAFITQAIANQPITVHGDGSHTRSYCYVSDLVAGLQKVMFSDNSKGEVINLGNPEEYTILQTAEIIKKLTNSQSEIIFTKRDGVRAEDPKKRKPNIDKAIKIVNWQPVVNFEQGLIPTIEYFKKLLNQSEA